MVINLKLIDSPFSLLIRFRLYLYVVMVESKARKLVYALTRLRRNDIGLFSPSPSIGWVLMDPRPAITLLTLLVRFDFRVADNVLLEAYQRIMNTLLLFLNPEITEA